MSNDGSGGSSIRDRIKGLARRVLANFEYGIILIGAGAIAILSLLDIISEVKPLIASTLALLSIMAFAFLRQASRRELESRQTADLRNHIVALSSNIRDVQDALRAASSIYEVSGPARRAAFDQALSDPEYWHFRGGTGTFLRARTMDAVSQASIRRAGSRLQLTLQVLDPANMALCEQYARYRQQLDEQRAPTAMSRWSARIVRLESLASLVAAAWYSQNGGLIVSAAVQDKFSTLRFDISNLFAIITNEDRNYPAVVVTPQSRMYFAMRRDLEESLEMSREINIAMCPELGRNKECIAEGAVRQFFGVIGDGLDRLSLDDIQEVLNLAFHRRDDYATNR